LKRGFGQRQQLTIDAARTSRDRVGMSQKISTRRFGGVVLLAVLSLLAFSCGSSQAKKSSDIDETAAAKTKRCGDCPENKHCCHCSDGRPEFCSGKSCVDICNNAQVE
jgi:hypothetical protein